MIKIPKEKIDAIVYYDMGVTIKHLAEELELTVQEVVSAYDYVVDNHLLDKYGEDNGGYNITLDHKEELRKLREMMTDENEYGFFGKEEE